jgi:PIN domain nuclease of toxin-antitoxin system
VISLDTHVLVFALSGQVSDRERRVLSTRSWSISAIVLWELATLVQLGRIEMDLDNGEIVRVLSAIHVWPIDLAVSRRSTQMDFKGDPADELIAARSVIHGVPLSRATGGFERPAWSR